MPGLAFQQEMWRAGGVALSNPRGLTESRILSPPPGKGDLLSYFLQMVRVVQTGAFMGGVKGCSTYY